MKVDHSVYYVCDCVSSNQKVTLIKFALREWFKVKDYEVSEFNIYVYEEHISHLTVETKNLKSKSGTQLVKTLKISLDKDDIEITFDEKDFTRLKTLIVMLSHS